MSIDDEALVRALWHEQLPAASTMPELRLHGPTPLLPSPFQVDVLATASIGLATVCAAALWARRKGGPPAVVTVDRMHAAAAFRSERHAALVAGEAVPAWDPIAGDYQTRDGWIRLHTNYSSHRDAVLRVLGVSAERDAVAHALRSWDAETLELRIVEAGGAAAMLRERAAFRAHPQGRALASEPLFAWSSWPAPPPDFRARPDQPLAGVRVLDLTRVIAGPVCTRLLAAYGADVLRIDPPGFEEVPALLPDTTAGKHRAALDLRSAADQRRFRSLLAAAHVLVVGYRSDALARLGLDAATCRQLNPALVSVAIDAYGWTGPWGTRRGFDSLVQMSSGIAAFGQAWKGCRQPLPLPAQALDHGTGYLAAAAACHGLTRALTEAQGCEVRLSLARTAELLWQLGTDPARSAAELTTEDVAPYLEIADSAWGPTQRVRCPGSIAGCAPRWVLPAGPLASDDASWSH